MQNPYFVIIVSLLSSAFFSGLEIAFLSANRLRVELKSKQGSHWAMLVSNYFKAPSKFISTILVGNNIALVIYGIYVAKVLNNILPSQNQFLNLLIVTFVSTTIVLLAAEFIPKILFRINPTFILAILIYPFQIIYFLLWPLVYITLIISKKMVKMLTGQSFVETAPAFDKTDLDHFINETSKKENENNEVDTEILKNAIDFGSVRVRDCMIPRIDIIAIEIQEPVSELRVLFEETRHSKILVYQEFIDNVIGYVHHMDLLKQPKSIKSILIPIIITTEAKPAQDMLNEFAQKHKSIALVVDEFGGTAGIVTVEDIMEEILGEIDDEHDDYTDIIEKKISDTEFELSASLEINYLNETYNFNIPSGDYATLAGFIIEMNNGIPIPNETITLNHFKIKVLKLEDARIDLVNLILLGNNVD